MGVGIFPIMASDVTQLLNAIESGDARAAEELLPLVYEELRKLAAAQMAHEPAQTLQATALVHDAWLKLGGAGHDWHSRGHFFAAAAEAMRRILVDRARRRNRQRHGAGLERVDLDSVDLAATTTDDDTLLRLDAALTRFATEEPDKAELVKLRYFSRLSIPDAARALGISEATAKRHWTYARAWLYSELTPAD